MMAIESTVYVLKMITKPVNLLFDYCSTSSKHSRINSE